MSYSEQRTEAEPGRFLFGGFGAEGLRVLGA